MGEVAESGAYCVRLVAGELEEWGQPPLAGVDDDANVRSSSCEDVADAEVYPKDGHPRGGHPSVDEGNTLVVGRGTVSGAVSDCGGTSLNASENESANGCPNTV